MPPPTDAPTGVEALGGKRGEGDPDVVRVGCEAEEGVEETVDEAVHKGEAVGANPVGVHALGVGRGHALRDQRVRLDDALPEICVHLQQHRLRDRVERGGR